MDQRALFKELTELLGESHLVTDKDSVEELSRVTIHDRTIPLAYAFPKNTEQVQAIVELANIYKVPVWVVSRGNNWGYGAASTQQKNSIVINLKRMNRILDVNEELAYAVIEPGVSYQQFKQYLKDHNYDLWIDCTDGTPNGSVIGNAMERGIGETPYGDHFGNLCGLEVILPSGKKIHTGGSSPSHSLKTWHLHKWGVGPYLEGMFSQSNYGIVTQAGIWLMPKPEAFASYVFELGNSNDFSAVIDAFRRLALQGVVNSKLHLINDFVSLTVITQRKDEKVEGAGQLSEDDLQKLRDKYKISPWSGGGGLYGTKAEIRVQKKIMRKELSKYGRLTFINEPLLSVLDKLIAVAKTKPLFEKVFSYLMNSSITMMEGMPYVHKILQGIPTDYFVNHAYFKHPLPRPIEDVHPARDHCGLIWFAPILPLTGQHLSNFLSLCEQKYNEYGFDFYVALLMLNPRSIVPLTSIIFDRETESDKAGELYEALLQLQYEHGYQQYRAGLKSWDHLFDRSPEYAEFISQIKTALDPNNILSPGKYGVKHATLTSTVNIENPNEKL